MIQKPRGTVDLFGKDSEILNYVINKIIGVARRYNYKEIITPIFESKELFVRSVGETSDIVQKEMYTFKDLADREFALRPEGTASVIRSVLENKLYNNVLKYYYFGPMFRYERPQKGRQRQFLQFGIEQINTNSEYSDAEIVFLALDIFKSLNIKNLMVKINTLGKKSERAVYLNQLRNYFEINKEKLCSDCNERLNKNVLRILDCKVDVNSAIIKNSPKIMESLSSESSNYFNNILKTFDDNKVLYEIDNTLVRGLDYYEDTIFEIVSTSEDFGAQATLLGGGRYNGLSEELGGPNIPSIGFAIGIERLIEALKSENLIPDFTNNVDCYFVLLDNSAESAAAKIISFLRNSNISCERSYGVYNFRKQCSKANDLLAKYLIVIGKEELEKNIVTLQNNKIKEKENISMDNIEKLVKLITKGLSNV